MQHAEPGCHSGVMQYAAVPNVHLLHREGRHETTLVHQPSWCSVGMAAQCQGPVDKDADDRRARSWASGPEPFFKGIREGLQPLGHVDGQNIRLEFRSAGGEASALSDGAAALVRLKVDIIVAWPTPAVAAAKQATNEIPIVMAGAGDPARRRARRCIRGHAQQADRCCHHTADPVAPAHRRTDAEIPAPFVLHSQIVARDRRTDVVRGKPSGHVS